MLSSYGFEIALIYYVVRKRTLTVVVKAMITGFTSEHCSRVILFYKVQMTNYSGIFRVIGQKVCLGASTSYWDKGLLSGTLTRRFLAPIPSVHLHP